MDNFSENNNGGINKDDESSTLFSAPQEYDDNIKSPKKRRIIAVIASLLAVCVLVGGTLAVIKFIPEKETENNTSKSESITVTDFDEKTFESVAVKNENGEFEFYPKNVGSSEDSESQWYLTGIAESKISTSKIGSVVSSAANLSAVMEITQRTFEQCGFETPKAKVSVSSSENGNYYLLLGDTSPDNFGVYLYSSVDEKIYLVDNTAAENFYFDALDLANTDAVPAVTVDTKDEKYVDSNGTLISFDKMEISGKRFAEPLVLTAVPQNEDSLDYFAYKIVSPVVRYANSDNVTPYLNAFASGISVSGVYSFETDTIAVKKFKLDNPDVALKITVVGQTFTYKFSKTDDGDYAMFGDGLDTIKRVSLYDAQFLSLGETDTYSDYVYLKSISDVSKMTFDTDDGVYSFDISENGEDDEEKYTVLYKNQNLTSQNFQDFYQEFVSISLFDFSVVKASGKPDMSIKIRFNDGREENILFYKISATEYTCSCDGVWVGKITSSSFNKLLKNLKTVSENKNIE